MRLRYLVAILLAIVIAGVVAGRRHIVFAQTSAQATIDSPATQSFLIIMGVGNRAVVAWDGSITATGGTIRNLQGWRFTAADSITGTTWKTSVRMTAAGAGT